MRALPAQRARWTWIAWLAGVPLLLWASGFLSYLGVVAILAQEAAATADCAVLFTGRQGRAIAAAGHFTEQPPRRLLFSGVGEGMSEQNLQEIRDLAPALMACCVDLDRHARNTVENGIEAARWARRNDCRSLLLATDDYHAPRSLLELRANLPDTAISVLSLPYVFAGEATRPLRTLVAEYHKLVARLAASALDTLALRAGFAR